MSGGFAEVGVKDYQVVVGAVRIQCEGNVDGGSGAEWTEGGEDMNRKETEID